MPPNGPDEWRARIGHWENRKLRWYQAHCGSRPRVPLYLHLGRVISEAPLLCVLLLLSLVGNVATGVCVAGNGTLSSLGKLARSCACSRRGKGWATPLLSLFLALSLLLVVAGDVETNPGPISDELLAQVDDSVLSEQDTYDVYREVVGLSGRWSHMCLALRLHPSDRSKIAVAHPGNPDMCLEAVVVKWLQKCYNYQLHGSPSWKILVKAVGDPAGGNDCTLAEAIAKKHPGAKHYYEQQLSEFAEMLTKVTELLDESTDLETLKCFLDLLSHPRTFQRYINIKLYEHCRTPQEIVKALHPQYINHVNTYLLRQIVNKFGNEQSKTLLKEYEDNSLRKKPLKKMRLQTSDEEMEIHTGNQTPATTNSSRNILEDALEKGYVLSHIWKVLVTGAAGSGKTTLKHRLFGEDPPSLRCSTVLAEAVIRAISREIVSTDLTGWFRVTDNELKTMLSEAIKAGVPMEMSLSETPGIDVHKQPKNVSVTDEPQGVTAPVGSSPKCSTETTIPSPNVPISSVSAHISSSKEELVQLLEKCQGSKRFLELKWIHFIDSGGQPNFHDVLPAFIRNTTATIFVTKLSERLDEHPNIEYYDRSGQLCGKPYRHALSNDQMLQCCIQTILSQPSTAEAKHSKTLVVGTHRDLESSSSESREEKNKKLLDMLHQDHDELVFYSPFSEVIFPIDAKTPVDQDHQVLAMIRKKIEDTSPPFYKIPIGWFLLEQDIVNASTGGVISKSECLDIAAILNINAIALTTALEYFDGLNIFLYYQSVLPEVLFSNPQVLLDKISELVHFSYCLRSDSPPVAVEGKWRQFMDKGIVTLDMLQDKRFSAHYIPDLFTPTDLIKLLEHLLIVAPLSSTEYFMPSLLQMISPNMVRKYLRPPSTSVAPLLVHFPAGCARNGVFCAVVVYFLSKCEWKIACRFDCTPLCLSRSCVYFEILGSKPVSIVLVDSFRYFEVHVTYCENMCSKIRKDIFSGLKAAAKALRYDNCMPTPAFFCECSSVPHAAVLVDDGKDCYLRCTKSTKCGPVTEQHAVWMDTRLPITEDSESYSESLGATTQATSISSQALDIQQLTTDADKELSESDVFDISSYLRRMEKVKILELGMALGLKFIDLRNKMNSETFLYDTIYSWLQKEDDVIKKGNPTWRTLINALNSKEIGQTGTAAEIVKNKGIILN